MNITLVGMPSSGKSMVGVLLAKQLRMDFIDGDLLIQQKEKRLLKEIIAQDGLKKFLKIEEEVHEKLKAENSVIAPGGSVIYGEKAMKHLKKISKIVYLKMSYKEAQKRLGSLRERGVAVKKGMTLKELYEERVPLYEKYADFTIDEKHLTPGMVTEQIKKWYLTLK